MEYTIDIKPEDGLQEAMQKLADATQAVSEEYGANIKIEHSNYRNATEAFVEDRHPITGKYMIKAFAVSEERDDG